MADDQVNDGRVQADVRAEEEAAKAAKEAADDGKSKSSKS